MNPPSARRFVAGLSFLALLALLGTASIAQAALFSEKGSDPAEWSWSRRLEHAQAVFVGEVLYQEAEDRDTARIYFLVEKSWKGAESPVVAAHGSRAACGGILLKAGERALVFLVAGRERDPWVTEGLLWTDGNDREKAVSALQAEVGLPVETREITAERRTRARQEVLASLKEGRHCGPADAETLTFPVSERQSLRTTREGPVVGTVSWSVSPPAPKGGGAYLAFQNLGPCWVEMQVEGEIAGQRRSAKILLQPWSLREQPRWDFGIDPNLPEGKISFAWREFPVPEE